MLDDLRLRQGRRSNINVLDEMGRDGGEMRAGGSAGKERLQRCGSLRRRTPEWQPGRGCDASIADLLQLGWRSYAFD